MSYPKIINNNLNAKLKNQFLNGVYRHHRFWPFTDTLKFSENWSYHISVIREFSVKSSREKWYSKEYVGEIRKVRIPKIRLTHMFFHPNDIFMDAVVEGPEFLKYYAKALNMCKIFTPNVCRDSQFKGLETSVQFPNGDKYCSSSSPWNFWQI